MIGGYDLIADKYPMGYYYLAIDQGKAFWLLIVCAIVSYVIIYKRHSKDYWIANAFTFNMPQTFLCGVLTLVLVCSFAWVDDKIHPNGPDWLQKIVWRKDYVPDLKGLCDKDGNCRFSSYDEYREYYVDLVLSEIADGTRAP